MQLKYIVISILASLVVIKVFLWQHDQIVEFENQLIIARAAATENEKVSKQMETASWNTINTMKSSIDSCNQLLSNQKKRASDIEKKGELHALEINELKKRIAESSDLCIDSNIPIELLNN